MENPFGFHAANATRARAARLRLAYAAAWRAYRAGPTAALGYAVAVAGDASRAATYAAYLVGGRPPRREDAAPNA